MAQERLRQSLLYIIFAKADLGPDRLNDRLNEARKIRWSAPKDARSGDTALFYFGAPNQSICAIARTATSAKAGKPGNWTTSKHGFFARHTDIETLPQPVHLQQIRNEFPNWPCWKSLRGRRVHLVPEHLRAQLAELLAKGNPSAQPLLRSWRLGEAPKSLVGVPSRSGFFGGERNCKGGAR